MAITQLRPCRLHYLLALALLQLQHGAPAAAAARRWQPRRALPRQGDGLQPAPQQVYLDWGAVFNGSASFAGDSAPTATKSATTAATAATAAAAPLEVPELPDWADWSAPLDKPIRRWGRQAGACSRGEGPLLLLRRPPSLPHPSVLSTPAGCRTCPRRNTFAHNSKVVRQANEAGEQLDVALYGDSIVALLWLKYQAVRVGRDRGGTQAGAEGRGQAAQGRCPGLGAPLSRAAGCSCTGTALAPPLRQRQEI